MVLNMDSSEEATAADVKKPISDSLQTKFRHFHLRIQPLNSLDCKHLNFARSKTSLHHIK